LQTQSILTCRDGCDKDRDISATNLCRKFDVNVMEFKLQLSAVTRPCRVKQDCTWPQRLLTKR